MHLAEGELAEHETNPVPVLSADLASGCFRGGAARALEISEFDDRERRSQVSGYVAFRADQMLGECLGRSLRDGGECSVPGEQDEGRETEQ